MSTLKGFVLANAPARADVLYAPFVYLFEQCNVLHGEKNFLPFCLLLCQIRKNAGNMSKRR